MTARLAQLRRGPDGSYQQYHSETVHGTKRQAQYRATEVLREIDTGGNVAQSSMTLAELPERWLAEWVAPNHSSVTVASYCSAMERAIPEPGAVPVQKLRPVDLSSATVMLRISLSAAAIAALSLVPLAAAFGPSSTPSI